MLKKSLPFTLLILSLVIFLCNCNSINIEDEIIEATINWNNDLTIEKIEGLESLYEEEVNYYGKKISNKDIIKRKLKFVNKHDDFEQSISELKVTKLNNNEYRCSYIKNAIFGGKEYEIDSYLIFENKEGNLYIIEENDSEILKREKISSTSSEKNSPCLDLVFKIIREKENIPQTDQTTFFMLDHEENGRYFIEMREDGEFVAPLLSRFILDTKNYSLSESDYFSLEENIFELLEDKYIKQLKSVCK